MNKEERQAALEAICRLEPDAKNYREEYPTQCESADGDAMIVRAALQSAQISETQLESEITKTAMSETQSPPVPVIEGLDNDIEHIEYLYEKERSDFINTASPMFLRFMQAARAYAKLQKGE